MAELQDRFMAQVHINGSSRATEVGIVYESNMMKRISFAFGVTLQGMKKRILRRVEVEGCQSVTSLSYRWINARNSYGQYYYEVRLYDDEDVKEMVMGIRMQGLDFVEIMAMLEAVGGSNTENQFPTSDLMLSSEAYYQVGQRSNEFPTPLSSSVPVDPYTYDGHITEGYLTREPLNPSGSEMEQLVQLMINPSFPVDGHVNVSPVRRNDGGSSSSQPPVDLSYVNPDDPFAEDQFDEASDSDYEASIVSDSDDEAEMESFIVDEDELWIDEEGRSGGNENALVMVPSEYRHPFQPPISFFDIGDDENEGDGLLDMNFPRVPYGSEPTVGMEWRDKKTAVCWVKEWSIRNNVEFLVYESKKTKWTSRCVDHGRGCSWELRLVLKKATGLWTLKEVSSGHSCRRPRLSQYHRNLDVELISMCIKKPVEKDPTVSIPSLVVTVRERYQYDVRYMTVWRAKEMVQDQLYGGYDKSYAELPRFIEAMRETVPGSVFVLEDDPLTVDGDVDPEKRVFRRLFWTFEQCRAAFNHCKPFLQIDGTFLYGKYKEKLLVAVAQDGNKKIVPVAFAIVKDETADDWGFFLRKLRRHIAPDKPGIGLISDRHKAIISAVKNPRNGWAEPDAYHMFCLRHIAANFYKEFGNKRWQKRVYAIGCTVTQPMFLKLMAQMYNIDEHAGLYLEEIPYHQWAQAYDEGRRYGHMTTNLVESINGVLRRTRHLPITPLVQATYFKLATMFASRGRKAANMIANGCRFSSKAQRSLDKFVDHAKGLTPVITNRDSLHGSVEDTIEYDGGRMNVKYSVRLDERWCDCGFFQANRFPCAHVITICNWARMDYLQYVDKLYNIDEIYAVYRNEFAVIQDTSYWREFEDCELVPDISRRRQPKGRPQSRRIRNEMDEIEERHPKQCKNCDQPGHDMRRCPHPRRPRISR